jgi:uncharacterized protein involved in outer membrane biogenesis
MDNPPVARAMRRWQTALMAVLAVLGLLAVLLSLLVPHLKSTLLGAIAARTGRTIRVDGEFSVHLLAWHPSVRVRQVYIGNPPWMPAGAFLQADDLALELDWHVGSPLLTVRSLEMQQATLHLLRDATGAANWQLHAGGGGRGPPLVRHIAAQALRVELHDERRHLQFKGEVSAGDIAGPAPQRLRIQGEGELNGHAAIVILEGDPLSMAHRGRAYHFTLEERSGATELSGHGALDDPFDFRYLAGNFTASGPDLKDLYFLVGIRLPDTGPFELSGKLTRRLDQFVYSDLNAISGKSDVGGALTVEVIGSHAKLTGELSSTLLRLKDLGARAAGRAPQAPAEAGFALPDTALPWAGIRRADVRVSYRAHALEVGSHELTAASALIVIDGGVLRVEHLSADFAQGTIAGSGRLDARPDPPHGELELRAAQLQLDQLKSTTTPGDPPLAGVISARAQLTGTGKSAQELGASATGTISAAIPHGVMHASIADLMSLNVTSALGLALRHGSETGIRCAVASFAAQSGVAKLDTLVVDTDSALITGSGEVQLDSQTLDLTLRGRPKKPALVLRSAVAIRGTLSHPELRLAGHEALAQVGAAVALGAILTPVAAVLAFVSPGLTHDADCAALLAQNPASNTVAPPRAAANAKPVEAQRKTP